MIQEIIDQAWSERCGQDVGTEDVARIAVKSGMKKAEFFEAVGVAGGWRSVRRMIHERSPPCMAIMAMDDAQFAGIYRQYSDVVSDGRAQLDAIMDKRPGLIVMDYMTSVTNDAAKLVHRIMYGCPPPSSSHLWGVMCGIKLRAGALQS